MIKKSPSIEHFPSFVGAKGHSFYLRKSGSGAPRCTGCAAFTPYPGGVLPNNPGNSLPSGNRRTPLSGALRGLRTAGPFLFMRSPQ